jgi:hypothetical protein
MYAFTTSPAILSRPLLDLCHRRFAHLTLSGQVDPLRLIMDGSTSGDTLLDVLRFRGERESASDSPLFLSTPCLGASHA